MNTRTKILEDRKGIVDAVLVIGTFDPLLAVHAERLDELSQAGVKLVVAVADTPGALLPLHARREMVTALRAVDFVVTYHDGLETSHNWIAVHDDRTLNAQWAADFKNHVRERMAQ